MDKNKAKSSLILIAVLVIIGIIMLILMLSTKQGDYITVSIDGRIFATYPLSVDAHYHIGDNNIITIKDHAAFMSEANCPDKLCINMGPISRHGQSIICLPNHVVATVSSDGPDAISR